MKRIFLLSDGLVNAGKVRSAEALGQLVDGLHDQGVVTSSYGIGDDFDETVMAVIAEYGRGEYAFLDKPENIPKFIRKGMRGLLSLIGTDATLSGRGLNGVVVDTIRGHDDPIRGALLGDVKESNHVQVVFQLEVSPTTVMAGSGSPAVVFQLTYKDNRSGVFETIEHVVRFEVTESREEALLPCENAEKVSIALAILQASEMEDHILELLQADRVADAIVEKKAILTMLTAHLASDTTGFVASIINRSTKTLAEMQHEDRNVKKMTRFCHYEREMERAQSAGSITYDPDEDHL